MKRIIKLTLLIIVFSIYGKNAFAADMTLDYIQQKAFENNGFEYDDALFENTNELCDTVLSLPFHPYMEIGEIDDVCSHVKEYLKRA